MYYIVNEIYVLESIHKPVWHCVSLEYASTKSLMSAYSVVI